MKQTEFIVLSAYTMTLTALGIDIMLPAFAEIHEHFGMKPESSITAQIITFFLWGKSLRLSSAYFQPLERVAIPSPARQTIILNSKISVYKGNKQVDIES